MIKKRDSISLFFTNFCLDIKYISNERRNKITFMKICKLSTAYNDNKSFHFIKVIFIMALYGKKLNIKKPNGIIQSANLYTTKSEVGSNYLSLKSGNDTVYAKLDVNGDVDCLVKKNGTSFKVKRVAGYKKYRMSELYPNIYKTMTSVPNDKDWYSFTEDLDVQMGADAMFRYCEKISTIPLINVSKVKSIFALVSQCLSLTSIPQLDTSNVEDMGHVFAVCPQLTTIPLLNTSKVNNMENMFYGCKKLTTIPLLNTSNVTNMRYMFCECSSLTTIPVLDIKSIKQNDGLQNIIRNTKITHITFKNKPAHIQITPTLLGKSDVIIHYV